MIGKTIKGYELRELIETGGFGAVYKALQPSVGREVAVKIILPQYATDPEFVRRFEVEAQMVAQLEHPVIVPLYDFWSDDQGAYLVMRWLRGGSLKRLLEEGSWAPDRVNRLMEQVSGGLSHAHERGIVHRDIKPANILLDESGNAYLSDFGFAKDVVRGADLTVKGTIIGSPAYMSPEQIRGEQVSPASDIYSLGLVLYELLVGEKPFGEQPPATLIYKHLSESLPPIHALRPEIPDDVEYVIEKATSKNPAERYSDVLALADDLSQALSGGIESGPAVTIEQRSDGVQLPERQESVLDLEQGVSFAQPIFVARERELSQLEASIEQAVEGNGHIVFVAGEAGMGKTALLDEFARRAQKNHPNMVVAVGNCNAFSGIGDPYLPFRDILGMLTGDIESRWAAGSITRGQAQNLLDISPETFKAVLDEGIHLIDVLVPASWLLKRFASGSDSPDFEESRLRRLVERTSTQSADLEQRQIFEECTKVFQT